MLSAGTLTGPVEELSDDTEMRLREDDKKWMQGEIRTAVDSAVHSAVDEFRPHGLRKLFFWLREWGILGTTITVFVALIAIIVTLGRFTTSDTERNTEFRTHTEDRLTGIGGRLTNIETSLLTLRAAQAPCQVLAEISKLDNPRFQKAFPALQTVVDQPPSKVNPPRPVLTDVAGKLLSADQNAPDYWPTVLKFLQFASAGINPDVPPRGAGTFLIANNTGGNFGRISHKVVILDGGEMTNTEFDHCRVIFTDHPVKMKNVTFTDSVFEFQATAKPNPYLQSASRKLLASDLATVSIPAL